MTVTRRALLAQSLSAASLLALGSPRARACEPVSDFSGLETVCMDQVVVPGCTDAVSHAVRRWPGQIAIGGARYSLGGQVAVAGGLHLDMRGMAGIVWLSPELRRVRVQAGLRWRDLQEVIDPFNLSVRTMQSYANFTVGGSVGVNVHGRYVGHGAIGESVLGLQLVLADGQVIEARRDQNTELFRAALGGFGAVGVITEVELALDVNSVIERQVSRVALADYPDFFDDLLRDPTVLMHNADLIAPDFDRPVAVTWRTTDKPPSEPRRLTPRDLSYGFEKAALWAVSEWPELRPPLIERVLGSPRVVWRNHEASLDVTALDLAHRRFHTHVLQEYFIPMRNFQAYSRALVAQIRQAQGIVNVSIRQAPPDPWALLPWAREPVFSFVIFVKEATDAAGQAMAGDRTRAWIELALAHEGRHYLPYRLHATQAQFDRAYPEAAALRTLKKAVDSTRKFTNQLWERYL